MSRMLKFPTFMAKGKLISLGLASAVTLSTAGYFQVTAAKTPQQGSAGLNKTVNVSKNAHLTQQPGTPGKLVHKKLHRAQKPPVDVTSFASSYVPDFIDLNPVVRAYCSIHGIEVGSPTWLAFGTTLFPNQGGGQPDYGWRKDHQIPEVNSADYLTVAHAILANVGYRPIFYFDNPGGVRQGYGRPWNWKADPLIDDPVTTGWYAPNSKLVIGHDIQHFSFKYLSTLAAQTDVTNEVIIAKVFMWRVAATLGGILRTNYHQYLHSSREVGRVLDFAVDAAITSWIDDSDAESILNWVKNVVMPSVGPTGIGFVYVPGSEGYHPQPELGPGSVSYWFPWQDAMMAVGMDRLGRYLQTLHVQSLSELGIQLQALAMKVAQNVASVISADGACPHSVGIDGTLGWIDSEKYGYGVWCYRALRIAGANGKADAVYQRYKSEPKWWTWFVESDGSWNPDLPVAK
ncbi:MAG: hypothetical protein ACKVS6_07605 [Planctomycetota bacterium]